jgi:hypothetical protein
MNLKYLFLQKIILIMIRSNNAIDKNQFKDLSALIDTLVSKDIPIASFPKDKRIQ